MINPQQYDEAMQRALVLAENGPAWGVNPQVGAVILDAKNRIIGEGWHKGAGTPHAEASSATRPKLSLRLGTTTASAARRRARCGRRRTFDRSVDVKASGGETAFMA